MKEITLTCRVITPLFMGGAEQEAEIRTQSIKGLIRFWWRALKAESDIGTLKKEESKIFGGYIEKQAFSSKVKIVILGNNLKKSNDIRQEEKLNWNFDSNKRTLIGNHSGIGYLFYSVLRREYIKPDNTFTLKIQSRDENALKQTIASLWCAIYLGGFGARSRRGAGSLVVDKIDNNIMEIDFSSSNSNSDILEWYKKNLKECLSIVNCQGNNNCRYSNLWNAKLIISNDSFNDWKEAFNDIGLKYSIFRHPIRSQIFDSAIFGLPVVHRNGTVLTSNRNIKRRSSPLIFKIVKFNESYYWIVLQLGGDFLPSNVKISYQNRFQNPNSSLMDNFLGDIQKNNKVLNIQEVFNAQI